MPTINKRFLLKLVLVVLVCGGALAGTHALQARRIPDALKRQAERAAEAGKLDAAVHYFRQYLEFEPEDVDAMQRLAELLPKRSSGNRGNPELLFLYDKILRLDPERQAVRRDALTLCLKMGRHSDAVTHAETLLKANPTDPALWQQLAAAHTGLNQLAEARKAYETAITHAPTEMPPYQRLGQLLWKNMNDPAGAKAILDRMVTAMPQEPDAYLVRARFGLFLAEDATRRAAPPATVDDALKDLRRVLELDPENADASLLLAEALQKGRDLPAAHAILRDAVALYPKDLRLIRSLSWLELVRGNVPASIAVLEDGLKQSPNGFDLLVPLADLLVQQGDTARTGEILERLKRQKAPAMQVKYLEARIAMREAKWAEAVALLEALRTTTVNLPGLEAQLNLLLASCWEKQGNPDAQEKAYRRVLNADPANVSARVGLATLFLNQGRFDEAGREYEVAVQSPYAGGEVHTQWVRLKARRLRLTGGSPDEWRKLEAVVTAAATKFGRVSSEPLILRGEVLAAQGRYAEAVKLLRQETARRPGDTRLWAALADMSADASGTPAGLAVMDEAQAAAGDGAEIRLARATLYAREPGRVRPIDQLGEGIETWGEADQFRLLYGLVEVYDEIGDRAGVVRTLKRIALRRPRDAALLMRLHSHAVVAGDDRAVAEARAALAKIEGEAGPSLVICDAVAGKDPAVAARLVATFGPAPNRADACLALAKWKAAAGDTADARRLLDRAFLLEPTRYETARTLIVASCSDGDEKAAKLLVTRLGTDPRWAGEPFRRLITGVLGELPPAARVTVLGWCKPLAEKDPGGLGWLAESYAKLGANPEADAIFIAATQTPTATSDDWLRLALRHAGSGRHHAAADSLAAARGKLPGHVFFALAAVYLETPAGQTWTPELVDPSAKRAFAQARLAVKLSRSDSPGAAKALEDYLAEKELKQVDLAWARRNLAMLYVIGGTPANRKRAMDLINDVAEVSASPEELRATASVLTTLSRYLEAEDRKVVLSRAIAALVAAHKISNSPRDLYHLSQLYRVAGVRDKSRECLQTLLNADRGNLYYLIAALEEMTEEGNFTVAEAFAKQLHDLYPGEFRAVVAVARYECRAGRPARALALADGYAAAADSAAGDHLTRSARVAELLDELARLPNVRGTPAGRSMTDAAVERYTHLVPGRPEAVVGIAGVLAADGRVSDAFARIEQYDRYLPKRVRAMAGLAAVRSGGASDRQFNSVESWLKESLAEDPGSIPMLLNHAEFLALRQQLKEAADLYDQVLKRDPRNVVALNNLAWLLAADPRTAQRAIELLDRATREVGLTGDLLDTRGRARITLRQFESADRDLGDALTADSTALRHFHIAVLKLTLPTPKPDEAAASFREARARGLDVKIIHPADLPMYRLLESREQKKE